MLPKTLDEWTLGMIEALLRSGYQEAETVDFKRQLPHQKSCSEKAGLAEDCCGFANTNGGFIVFGVEDAQNATGESRIVGIDTPDFPAKFGEYPSKCQPSVDWRFLESPIRLPDARLIQVVRILPSWRGPHACQHDNKWVFKKRTNKGNEDMSYEEIRSAFLHHHDRLRRVFLLKVELGEIRYEAEQHVAMVVGRNAIFPARFDLSVLDAIWSDLYPIVHPVAEIRETITLLRRLCRTVNRNADVIQRYSFQGGGHNPDHVNRSMNSNKESLPEVASTAAVALAALECHFPSGATEG